jgi:uncharacterized protein DUF1799
MYEAEASQQELDAFGFLPSDQNPFGIWPDNLTAYRVFEAMRTQWRMAMGGPTGLDYAALPEVWRRCKVPQAERDQVFDDLQVMEYAALAEIRRQSEKAKNK